MFFAWHEPQLPKIVGIKGNKLLKLNVLDPKIVDQVSENTLGIISKRLRASENVFEDMTYCVRLNGIPPCRHCLSGRWPDLSMRFNDPASRHKQALSIER